MHRIDNESASTTLPAISIPIHPGSYFYRTRISSDFLNSIQEELCYTIETAGFLLDKNNQAQLLEAIQQIIADAGIVPPPTGGGNYLFTQTHDIFSSTGDIVFNIGDGKNININASNVLGSGAFGSGTGLQLTTGSEIIAFCNSTNTLSTGVAWNAIVSTQKAIIDSISYFWNEQPQQYIYGSIDSTSGITSGFLWDGQYVSSGDTSLYEWPWSFANIDAIGILALELISFDIWVDYPPDTGDTYEFNLHWEPINQLSIAAGATHGSVTWPGTIITSPTQLTGITLTIGNVNLHRINYRIIYRLFTI